MLLPKRPRQYASEIMAINTLQERRAMLNEVPVEYRDMVKHYILQAESLDESRQAREAVKRRRSFPL